MAPTASAAIHEPCHSDRMRGAWSVASRSGIAKVGQVLGRAAGERREEQERRARPARPARRCVRRASRTDPTLPLRSWSCRRPFPACRLRGQNPTPEPIRRLRAAGSGLGEQGEVRRPGHLDGTQRHQVLGRPLDVEQPVAAPSARSSSTSPTRADLRRVALAVEHRLPREQAADGDAVQAAGQPVLAVRPDRPGLDAVHPAEVVQPAVRRRRRPCGSSRPGGFGSAQPAHHLVVRRVDPDLEPPAGRAQRPADPQAVAAAARRAGPATTSRSGRGARPASGTARPGRRRGRCPARGRRRRRAAPRRRGARRRRRTRSATAAARRRHGAAARRLRGAGTARAARRRRRPPGRSAASSRSRNRAWPSSYSWVPTVSMT